MGSLEVITGCMFSGKTRRLQDRIHRERFRYEHSDEHPTVLLFKPTIDDRYGEESKVISHDESEISCLLASSSSQISDILAEEEHKQVRVVGIEEIQFFDEKIVDLCLQLTRKHHIDVIAAGLNLDFRGEPFCFRDSQRHMGELLAYAQIIRTFTAFCAYKPPEKQSPRCVREAHFTQRLFPNGEPVPYEDPLLIVGGKETLHDRRYEARCLEHHFVPGRPQ